MTADDKFPTTPRPNKGRWRRRGPSRFELWAWSPVISFRIGLTAGYLGMIYFGISSIVVTIPAIDVTSPRGYAIFWAAALAVGGAIAALGSLQSSPRSERLELVGSSLVSLTVGSFATLLLFLAYILGEAREAPAGAGFVAMAVPFIIRTLWLASQTRRK